MIGIVGDGGCVVLDFPNGEHPVDPHTGVMFFHLLTKGVRADIIRYFDRTRSIDVALQQKLLGIHNIAMPKINCIDDVLPKFLCVSRVVTRSNSTINPNPRSTRWCGVIVI